MENILDIIPTRVEEAVRAVGRLTGRHPDVGIILGSGQGGLSRRLSAAEYIPYGKIPHFYQPTVQGHEGVLGIGGLEGRTVAVLEGRIHLYEGYFIREIVFPVRLLHALGARTLIIGNAAGGLAPRFSTGRIMVVRDHINLMGDNPLIGQVNPAHENLFQDMTGAYDAALGELARGAGEELGERLDEGVLAAVQGPSYETPAESRMLLSLGADAVTMSTVPEVIMARFLGMRVLGLSLITNVHRQGASMDHREVLKVSRSRADFIAELISRIVRRLPPAGDGTDRPGGSRPE